MNIRNKTAAEVEFLTLWGKPYPIEGFHLYWLPKSVDGRSNSWLFREKSRIPRLALAARITRPTDRNGESDLRYVLDFEGNPGNSNIVIVWRKSRLEIAPSALRGLIRSFAMSRSVMKDWAFVPDVSDMQIGHRKHTIPKEDLESGIGFLERIFSTPLYKPYAIPLGRFWISDESSDE